MKKKQLTLIGFRDRAGRIYDGRNRWSDGNPPTLIHRIPVYQRLRVKRNKR